MRSIHVKHVKLCAFCKHWYDPANKHIKPKNILGGLWYYDELAKSVCAISGTPKKAVSACSKFELKI